MTKLAQYPVRPTREVGESLAGFAFRIRTENGYSKPIELEERVGQLYSNTSILPAGSSDRRKAVRQLQQLLGKHCALDVEWWSEGTYSVAYYPCGLQLRLCPLCLHEFGFHPAIHELPMVAACAHHRRRLVTKCPHCASVLTWRTLTVGWRCKCGAAITDTVASPASALELLQADLISRLVDVVLPAGFSGQERTPSNTPLCRLEPFYYLLHGLHLLRIEVIEAIRMTHRGRQKEWNLIRPRGRHHAWELRLATCWPSSFHQEMLKLLRRLFRGTDATLIALDTESIPIQFLLRLRDVYRNPLSSDPIRQELEQLLHRYRVPLGTSIYVLRNPRYSTKDYDDRLKQFQDWWVNLRANVKSGTRRRRANVGGFALPTMQANREAMAVTLVSRLIDAANRKFSPQRYCRVFDNWCYPGTGLPPLVQLRGMVHGLFSLPYGELRAMSALMDTTDGSGASC